MSTDFDWAFVVDTDRYAGNCERQMVAWMAGHVGECGKGEKYVASARAALPPSVIEWLDVNVAHIPDDHGCHRPATICPTPGWWNDGIGNVYPDSVSLAEAEPKFRADMRRHMPRSDAGIAKHPSYFSIALCLRARPTPEVVAALKERAASFKGGQYDEPGNIAGFRIVHRVVSFESEAA